MSDRYVLRNQAGRYVVVHPSGRDFALVFAQKAATRFDRKHAHVFADKRKSEGLTPVRLVPKGADDAV